MVRTTFRISKLDCPSEEQMVRARLEGMADIQSLTFDITKCQLEIYHHTNRFEDILAALDSLQLDTKLISSEAVETMDICFSCI